MIAIRKGLSTIGAERHRGETPARRDPLCHLRWDATAATLPAMAVNLRPAGRRFPWARPWSGLGFGDRAVMLFASSGGCGLAAPIAPGTFGTLPALPLAAALAAGGQLALAIGAAAVFVLGVWASDRAIDILGVKDPGPVTVDEIAGYLVTMLGAPNTPAVLIAAFFLFRAADIAKPFPARRLEALPKGLGVMADDVAAGVWAAAALQGLLWIWPALATLGPTWGALL